MPHDSKAPESTLVTYARGPRLAEPLLRVVRSADGALDRLYGSPFNPLYRSGTWAIGLFLVACVTGIWILLFYRVGAPYESVQSMVDRPYLVGWVRSLHRYSSDAALVAVILHMLRLFAESKTWGPRVLAWVSGLVLLGLTLIVAFSGFILAWDTQGQALAVAGARLLSALPFLYHDLSGALSSAAPPPTSFIFTNLFLHLALPLGMVGGLWIHTLRLARSKWLPSKAVMGALTAGLIALSLLMPAPLSPEPDAFQTGQTIIADVFYSGWLAAFGVMSAEAVWATLAALAFVLLAAPWYWRPRASDRPQKSKDNQVHCEGCGQCVVDCPFEAIAMVARTAGEGSAEVARVDRNLCTSCGICAGSCSQLAIGPPDRSGHVQLRLVKELRAAQPSGGVVLVSCKNAGVANLAPRLSQYTVRLVPYPVECTGTLHPTVVAQLLKHFDGVMVVSCPPEACRMREGTEVAEARLLRKQNPSTLEPDRRIHWATVSPGADGDLERRFSRFVTELGVAHAAAPEPPKEPAGLRWQRPAAVVVAVAALASLGAGNRVAIGGPTNEAILRINWRMAAPRTESCRPPTADEVQRMPQGMAATTLCDRRPVAYRLTYAIDGGRAQEARVEPVGSDRTGPLIVDVEHTLAPGSHRVFVRFEPIGEAPTDAPRASAELTVQMTPGRVAYIVLDTRSSQFRAATSKEELRDLARSWD